ncbi:MAG TPA: PLP-dependent aminotransferase family protein [Stellaceae bacterium]|jgi:GntR family transcriptional regulator/MocR family aminotransferase|nr:PLP-dependent aminotransferase family protein [Stellaceae bacterium]
MNLPASLVDVDRLSPVPLFRQIYDRTRGAIAAGRLRPGDRLPSARSLAAQLGAARGTIEAAYAMLAGEGWIVARGAAGTVVAPQLDANSAAASRPADWLPQAAPSTAADHAPRPFRMGLPALDAFPRKLWARLVAREARGLHGGGLSYPDPAGDAGLREAIAAYLAISRGISCAPSQIFVTAGYQGALGLIARTLLAPGAAVHVEDPCYHLTARGLKAVGVDLLPVPVDADGMQTDRIVSGRSAARLAIVTPAHQSPLGVALSLPRRLALLAWAEAAGAAIVEDDYDGEFHYAGRPLPALKSLDRGDVVLYVGSFSKVLFPGLRLGYLVAPARLVPLFAAAAPLFTAGCGRLDQIVVARFMAEGHFARHLKRMRGLYGARRTALATALADAFGERLQITLQPGGMHLLARPAARVSDTDLVALAEQRGLAPSALSQHALAAGCGPGLLLSFTNIPEDRAAAAAQALFEAIGPCLG